MTNSTIILTGCAWCGALPGQPCTTLTGTREIGYEHVERIRAASTGLPYLGECEEGTDFMGGMCEENAYALRDGIPYCPEHLSRYDALGARA